MTKIYVPPIKSQGIKTKLVPWIRDFIPGDFTGTWIEPFMGTGVVAFNLVPLKAVLCDTNPHLINFYRAIQDGEITPSCVREFLVEEGAQLYSRGEEHYYYIRERFNSGHNPLDFLFLNRSCFNGMIRFNRKGGFNVPFCRKNNRFAKAYVTRIVNQVSYVASLIKENDFIFTCRDFKETIESAVSADILYCDPPYIDRNTDYFNGWNENCEHQLYDSLSKANCSFILSTWHHNAYRKNEYLDSLWNCYSVFTREHFYHVGAVERNRNPVTEALVTNIR